MTLQEIATTLNEPNIALIEKIVNVLGIRRVTYYLQQTLRIEAEGGMLTRDRSRRRSLGGVFFRTIKQAVSDSERRAIWPKPPDTPPPDNQPTNTPPTKPPPPNTPPIEKAVQAISWEEAKKLVNAIIQSPGKGTSVKLTLVGRPKKVAKAGEGAVVVSLQGKPPGALPKGLPTHRKPASPGRSLLPTNNGTRSRTR